jgi:hypothetical protein
LGNIIGALGEAVHSESIFELGMSVHSYFGWIVWAVIYSFLWFPIVKFLDTKHVKNRQNKDNVIPTMPLFHDRSDVYIAVLIGGFGHHFVDALSHYSDPAGGKYYPRGRFLLITPQDPGLIDIYVIFAVIIAGLFVARWIQQKKINKANRVRGLEKLRTWQVLKVFLFTGIAIFNCIAMYAVMASRNVVATDTVDLDGVEYTRIFFLLGNALFATHEYDSGSNVAYSAVCVLAFVIIFTVAYAKNVRIPILAKQVRLDLLTIIGFITSMVIGYILQPWYGNVSGDERDFGAFIFLWSTIGMLLVGALAIMRNGKPAVRLPENSA